MIVTNHELAAASSAVAGLAIIGAFLGVRSANQNALNVVREDRAERRRDELTALKRAAYIGLLGALTELSSASVQASLQKSRPGYSPEDYGQAAARQDLATRAVLARLDEVRLIAPPGVYSQAKDALDEAGRFEFSDDLENSAYVQTVEALQSTMHADLREEIAVHGQRRS